jgi:hypothetical protein
MKLDQETFKKWRKWSEQIKRDLMELMDYKQIHDHFINVVNNNLDHVNQNNGKKFCDFVRKCYAVQAAVGIRRHMKSDKESISLMRLLEQMKECANQFADDYYRECFPLRKSECDESGFRHLENEKVISKQRIEGDIALLKEIANKVESLVDQRVAHLDKRGYREDVTYQDIDDSLNVFNEIACKYVALLTGHSYLTLKPEVQYNWKTIFTVPLDIRERGPEQKNSVDTE